MVAFSAVILPLVSSGVCGAVEPEAQDETSALEERLRQERQTMDYRFVITPHKPSYILPLSWNQRPNDRYESIFGNRYDKAEIKFQLSLKIPVWDEVFGDGSLLAFGYTQQSWWQAYNERVSRPFRETNHEPELMLSFITDQKLFGFTGKMATFGLVHQSNGMSEPRSRSWNRLYLKYSVTTPSLAIDIKPWYRIPEARDEDDNVDIHRYLGYGELVVSWNLTNRVLSMMLRNNLREENRGAVEINWSVPLTRRIHGYVQYFNGYGESLVDYDVSSNRLGLGVLLINWI